MGCAKSMQHTMADTTGASPGAALYPERRDDPAHPRPMGRQTIDVEWQDRLAAARYFQGACAISADGRRPAIRDFARKSTVVWPTPGAAAGLRCDELGRPLGRHVARPRRRGLRV